MEFVNFDQAYAQGGLTHKQQIDPDTWVYRVGTGQFHNNLEPQEIPDHIWRRRRFEDRIKALHNEPLVEKFRHRTDMWDKTVNPWEAFPEVLEKHHGLNVDHTHFRMKDGEKLPLEGDTTLEQTDHNQKLERIVRKALDDWGFPIREDKPYDKVNIYKY